VWGFFWPFKQCIFEKKGKPSEKEKISQRFNSTRQGSIFWSNAHA
jgi:hypothetical protein